NTPQRSSSQTHLRTTRQFARLDPPHRSEGCPSSRPGVMERDASAPAAHDQFFPSSIAQGCELAGGFGSSHRPEEHFAVPPQRPKPEPRPGHERTGATVAGPRAFLARRGVDRMFPCREEKSETHATTARMAAHPTKANQTLRIMRRCPRSESDVEPVGVIQRSKAFACHAR
ncbi:MAG TPA: hypothetical protein VF308_14180, partial [Caldimonas sp.]